MRLATRVVAAGVLLGAFGGALVGASRISVAQNQGGASAPLPIPVIVGVYSADGGALPVSGSVNAAVTGTVAISTLPAITGTVDVSTMPTVDARVTTPPDTFLAVAADSSGTRLGVDIANTPAVTVSGTPTVSISGTVALSTASLATITAASAERVCTYGTPVVTAALSTTPAIQPATAQTGRTEVTIMNLEHNKEVWCHVNGTPTSTAAIVILENMVVKLNVTDAAAVNCRCASATCRMTVQEAICTHP